MLLSTILHTWCILFCIPITSLKAMFCAQCQPSIGQLSSVRHNTSDQPLQMMTEKKSNPRNPFFKKHPGPFPIICAPGRQETMNFLWKNCTKTKMTKRGSWVIARGLQVCRNIFLPFHSPRLITGRKPGLHWCNTFEPCLYGGTSQHSTGFAFALPTLH